MNPTLLIALSVLFYLAERHTADPIWVFCMGASIVLAICAVVYRKERRESKADQSPGPSGSQRERRRRPSIAGSGKP